MATLSLTRPITLAIAGLPMAIHGAEPALEAQLAAAYTGFLTGTLPQFTLEVLNPEATAAFVAGAVVDAPMAPHLQISGPCVLIHEPGWVARLDLERGTGQVRASEPLQFAATEYTLRVVCAYLTFAAGGLLVHGAGIAYNTHGYLLLGPSGAGKTTAARNAPPGSVLNDDLILILPASEGWQMYATPFTNPSQLGPRGPACAPLTGIFRLRQAPQVACAPMARAAAAAELISLTPVVSLDPYRAPTLLGRAHQIAATVSCAYLELLPDPSYWSAILPAAERTTL
ncbi:MAG: hypothetical protein AB4911_18930 [Oscillochloridaceae bacterium umkhey_bin13]